MTLEDRFWTHVDKGTDEECWVWRGARMSRGYGQINRDGTREDYRRLPVGAHRVSWEIHFGPIPEGYEVCHKCNNKPCVNPSHLYVATHQQNMQDHVNSLLTRSSPQAYDSFEAASERG